MYKLLAIVLAVTVSVCSFAADVYKFPSVLSKDKAHITAMLEVAPDQYSKFYCSTLLAIADKDPATFEELCATIDKLSETYKVTPQAILNLKKAFYGRYPKFTEATYALVKNSPSPADIPFVIYSKHNFTTAEKYAIIVNCLVKFHKTVSAVSARQGVEAIIEYAVMDSNITTQKEDLQKLNRLYSQKVLVDKAAWEPVASMLRTALATY